MGPRNEPRAALEYASAAVISSIAAFVLLKLWNADLRVPFDYGGDAFAFEYLIKATVERGWYLVNPRVGAPWGLDLRDYPLASQDTLHLVVIKCLSVFRADWGFLINAYFLLGFPLIACSALAVFRHFRVASAPAIVASVLYSFLPSRIIKGEAHLFLDVFYQVPLAVLVLLWICGEGPPFTADRAGSRWPSLTLTDRRSIAALALSAVVATTGIYNAFFAMCLAVAAGAWASVERRSLRNVIAGAVVAGAILVIVLAQGLPTILYHIHHGPNPEVGARNSGEAEVYGLKIVQLLLPPDGHRLAWVRDLRRQYNLYAPLSNENSCVSLGLVGDVGFLVLLGVVIGSRHAGRKGAELLRPLAVLNLMALLLGTIGGFSSIIALLVTPQLRTYSRINVFIAFFALFTVAILLQRILEWRLRVGEVVAAIVLGLGLLDQSGLERIRPYAQVKKSFDNDARFVERMEAALPADSMVFQLPFIPFPDNPAVGRLWSFDPFRLSLHATTLRFSAPVMRNRPGDQFARKTSALEPGHMVATLAWAGYSAVVVAREGYEDEGAGVESGFRKVLDAQPVVDDTGRFAFYNLSALRARMPAPTPAQSDAILNPLDLVFARGFSGLEHVPGASFRWCGPTGEAAFVNDERAPRRAIIRMTIVAGRPPARLTIEGDILAGSFDLAQPVVVEREIVVPPGRHAVRFHCDGQTVIAPGDPRTLVWRIEGFGLEGEDDPAVPALPPT